MRPPKSSLATLLLLSGFLCCAITTYAGRRNPSLLLVLLFLFWVFSPFLAALSARKSPKPGLRYTSVAVAILSPCLYALVAFAQVRIGAPALPFLVVPLLSNAALLLAVLL